MKKLDVEAKTGVELATRRHGDSSTTSTGSTTDVRHREYLAEFIYSTLFAVPLNNSHIKKKQSNNTGVSRSRLSDKWLTWLN